MISPRYAHPNHFLLQPPCKLCQSKGTASDLNATLKRQVNQLCPVSSTSLVESRLLLQLSANLKFPKHHSNPCQRDGKHQRPLALNNTPIRGDHRCTTCSADLHTVRSCIVFSGIPQLSRTPLWLPESLMFVASSNSFHAQTLPWLPLLPQLFWLFQLNEESCP